MLSGALIWKHLVYHSSVFRYIGRSEFTYFMCLCVTKWNTECMLNQWQHFYTHLSKPNWLHLVFCVHNMYLVNSGMKYGVNSSGPVQPLRCINSLNSPYSHAPLICDKLEWLHGSQLLKSVHFYKLIKGNQRDWRRGTCCAKSYLNKIPSIKAR